MHRMRDQPYRAGDIGRQRDHDHTNGDTGRPDRLSDRRADHHLQRGRPAYDRGKRDDRAGHRQRYRAWHRRRLYF